MSDRGSFRWEIEAAGGAGAGAISGYRGWIEASPGPARCSLAGRGAHLLVRVRLHDEGAEDPQPEVYCDLRPDEALRLARQLLTAIDDAERQTRAAGYWRAGR